jgi:hypothetical protein
MEQLTGGLYVLGVNSGEAADGVGGVTGGQERAGRGPADVRHGGGPDRGDNRVPLRRRPDLPRPHRTSLPPCGRILAGGNRGGRQVPDQATGAGGGQVVEGAGEVVDERLEAGGAGHSPLVRRARGEGNRRAVACPAAARTDLDATSLDRLRALVTRQQAAPTPGQRPTLPVATLARFLDCLDRGRKAEAQALLDELHAAGARPAGRRG